MLEVGADKLSCVERIALGAFGHELDDSRGVGVEQMAHKVPDRVGRQRLERNGQMIELAAAPVRPPVEQLGPRKDDHQHRRLAARLHDELGQVEEALARPVQVLENDHERVAARRGLDGRPPGGKEEVFVDAFGAGLADRRREEPGISVRVLHPDVAQPRSNRLADLGWCRVLGCTGEREDDLAHRPVRELLSVGQALCGGHRRAGSQARQPAHELLHQPRLAHAGGRDDADQRRPSFDDRTTGDELQLRQVVLAAHERQADAALGLGLLWPDHEPRRHGRRFAPGPDFDLVAEFEIVGGPYRAVAGQDRPWLGLLLEPRRDVGRVAGDEEVTGGLVAAGHDLARADAEPDRDPVSEQGVGPDAVSHHEGGGHRAIGIVAVRGWEAEDCHHGIADELLDRASVLLDALARDRVVAGEQAAHLLRVEVLAERGRARHVGEEDGDDAALFGGDRHRNR